MTRALRFSCLAALVAGLALTGGVAPARAHSSAELDPQLNGRGNYFQSLDRPAPEFDLYDIDRW